MNFWGQWHCSHVSRAGRRVCTGEGIGREYVPKATATTCRTPSIFALTNQGRPGADVALAHATRECGESRYAVYSGDMTVWHVCPQNWAESMYSTPMYGGGPG